MGIAIDINPITGEKTGKLSVREKIKQTKQVSRGKKRVNMEKSKNTER